MAPVEGLQCLNMPVSPWPIFCKQIGHCVQDLLGKFCNWPQKWSLDNFAVNTKLQIKLIDLENIILVNKTEIEQVKAPGWDIEHHSTAFGCENRQCFSYFAPDLCSHKQSDHNYFGACQGVIVPLLTNGVPDQMVKRLIQECAWPSNPGGRLEAVNQLKDRLLQI